MKVIFLDIDGVLTHTDFLNWQTRHIDPEKVLEQIPSVISLDKLANMGQAGLQRWRNGLWIIRLAGLSY